MKNRIKICIVLINRASFARVRFLLKELKKNKIFKLQIIIASSAILNKYGAIEQVLKKDKLKIESKFFSHVSGENNETMTKSLGLLVIELASIFSRIKPDICLNIADRYETLAIGVAASYMNIFLVHLQGGELTGSIDESVRHAVTKLSHLHLACTKKSKKRIIQMGENPKYVFNVGCPSIDLIKNINFSKKVLLNKYKYGVGHKVDITKPYLVCLLHPVTTESDQSNKITVINTLEAIYKINIPCIWLWPNVDAGSNITSNAIRSFRERNKFNKINFYTNFEPDDFIKLINNALCLVGNSSSGIREASFLSIPTVNIGSRQIFRERGSNVIDTDNKLASIYKAIILSIKNKKNIKKNLIYGNGNSSHKIVKIIKKIKLDTKKTFYDL